MMKGAGAMAFSQVLSRGAGAPLSGHDPGRSGIQPDEGLTTWGLGQTAKPAPDRLAMKLSHAVSFTSEDKATLAPLGFHARSVDADKDVIAEGDRPDDVHLVVEGLLCRYKTLPDGRRQIMALLLPGDICDLHVAILDRMDHSIGAVAQSRVAAIPRHVIESLLANPRIAQALWWATLVDEAILREWLVNVGQRDACRRFAHLLCELYFRYEVVGLTQGQSYKLRLTQVELGNVLGLSTVHVNRTLQALRRDGLVVFKGSTVSIPDMPRLTTFASFNANYLHLGTERHGTARAERRGGAHVLFGAPDGS